MPLSPTPAQAAEDAGVVRPSGGTRHQTWRFERIASFPVFENNADPTLETVAEIVDVSEDGTTLVYTDSPNDQIGFVDITDPDEPQPLGTLALDGEPTSVAVSRYGVLVAVNTSNSYREPSGHLAVVDLPGGPLGEASVRATLPLAGQPDAIDVSRDDRYAAVAIENERDEEACADTIEGECTEGDWGLLPQSPAGLLQIVDLDARDPSTWDVRDVDLTGLTRYAPEDPEPEYVDINGDNLAVVTLQENNHLAVVDLETGKVRRHWSAGDTDVDGIDATEDGVISLTESLEDVPREPDAAVWLGGSTFATANEGDLFGGSRGFSIWRGDGRLVHDSGNDLEELAVRIGHYPESRSENKGTEPEGAAFARYGKQPLLFVGSERGNFVAAYDVRDPDDPELFQVLPTGVGPEGILPIPKRDLLVVTSEVDDPPLGVRTVISIYQRTPAGAQYPDIVSADDDGQPLAWSALSGLAPGDEPGHLRAVWDSYYGHSRVFDVDASRDPAVVTDALPLTKDGEPVGYDLEGIANRPGDEGGFWLASEGGVTVDADDPASYSSTPNLLVEVGRDGEVLQEVGLPDEVEACRQAVIGDVTLERDQRRDLRYGFEGVAVLDDGRLVAAQQLGWRYPGEAAAALGCDELADAPGTTSVWIHDTGTGTWDRVAYELEPVADTADWVGLSEVTVLPGGDWAFIERDNATGAYSATKWLTRIPADALDFGTITAEEKVTHDLLPALRETGGWITDKPEGFTVDADGHAFVVTDNDGVEDATGETQLLRLGPVDELLPPATGTVELGILSFNDLHGALDAGTWTIDPSDPDSAVPAGGVAHLASLVRELEAERDHTVVVSAGDLVGASPLSSALFHDEPIVEAAELIGVDLAAVGNHEFDEGVEELVRLQEGGCHPEDGCFGGDGWDGADFPFLAANVVSDETGDPLFPPYHVVDVDGIPVAFVGLVLEGTPSIVTPSGIAGWSFRDEADTLNALIPELRQQGVEAVVAVLHEGGTTTAAWDGCGELSGPALDVVERFDDEVDAVLTGHSHAAYICEVDGVPVTQAGSGGRVLTELELQLDRATGDVVDAEAQNRVVTHDREPAADLVALVEEYTTLAAPLAERVIGSTTAAIGREATDAGESPLGDVIADAQLAATAPADVGGAQVAFMNPGGIRADLDAGDVTYQEAFTVQPFRNWLITMTLTGGQIEQLLDQQWCDQPFPRILQPSAGFAYSWDTGASVPCDERVGLGDITLGGAPLVADQGYRITVNSFLADGGDGFTVLTGGTDRVGGAEDLLALEQYLAANSPVAPGPVDRITTTG